MSKQDIDVTDSPVRPTTHDTPVGKLPLGINATPEDSPEGLHYLYQGSDIFMATDDYERLVAQTDEVLNNRVRLPEAHELEGRSREGDEALRRRGVTRLRTASPEDVPETVTALRRPRDVHHAVHGATEQFVPRVFPNTVLSLHYHASWHTGGPRLAADPLPRPPGDGFFRLPGHGVTIGVLDTGMWKGQLDWYNGHVTVRDEDPLDVDSNGDLEPEDGHGTFITGILRAHAPGAKVVVHALRSQPGGYSAYITDEDLSFAISELGDRGVDIINCSLGGAAHGLQGLFLTPIAIDELRQRHPGIVIVASAGNDRTDIPMYPAALTSVIAVASVTDVDERADYSNFGKWVDAAAPGQVHSTFVEWDDSPADDPGEHFHGFATWSGTSFSTPKVAAAIATRLAPGGWRQYLWFLRPKNARQAADRLIHDRRLPRVEGLGTIVRPKSYVA
jgi:hypothetical protein